MAWRARMSLDQKLKANTADSQSQSQPHQLVS